MPSPPVGESPADAWVGALVGRVRPGERVLVLGRSRASLSLVRRWASRRGGVLGLEVAAAGALAGQLHRPEPLPGSDVLPPGSALGRRIGDRPGLQRAAQRWMRALRLRSALGLPLRAPAVLEELLPTPFGDTPEDRALVHLAGAVAARGAALTASMRWDRVVTLGFDDDPLFLDPAAAAVARGLGGPLPDPLPPAEGPLPAIEVPDVVAEARLAAAIAAEDPAGTLILVAGDTTARRVRDALDRNGLGGALRDPSPLGAHPVAAAVQRAIEWFAPGAPSILAVDVFAVLRRTSLSGRAHPAVAAWLAERLPDDPAAGRFDARALGAILEECRLRDAPLERWLARATELAAADRPEVRRGAVHLLARLRVLEAAARGVPLVDVLGGPPPALDDFEDALRELLGDPPGPAVPPPHTFGALARFLVDLRLRVHDDPVARAILGALRDRADQPATPARLHEALSGPGLDPGLLPDGVDVLPLDEWDGRPCRTLLVLDAHDHGLARPQPPDPLLSDEAIRDLGEPTGGDRLSHALLTVRRAAGRAGRVVVVVSRTDANGRDTVAPLDLPLTPAGGLPAPGTYGLRLPLPERLRLDRIRAAPDLPAGGPPAVDDLDERAFLARGASLEWYLDGRHAGPAPAAAGPTGSMSEVLATTLPALPDGLRPWLGFAEGVPAAALPDRAHSVSRLLQPLARCPFQAFAGVVLGVEPRTELTDALDPRELGLAAHGALERAAAALDFRRITDDDGADGAVAALQRETDAAFDEILARFGALSPARTAAAHGLRSRWRRHFAAWVTARRRWPPLQPAVLREHPAVRVAEARFRALVPGGRALPWYQIREWIVMHRDDGPDTPAEQLPWLGSGSLPEATHPDLPAVLADPAMAEVRAALRDATANLRLANAGPYERTLVLAEVPFGRADAAPAAVHGAPGDTVSLPAAQLRFGTADLQLQGQIDRVDVLDAGPARGLVITDYKTGRAELTGEQFRRGQWALEDPQLLVYAMVVARAHREGLLPASVSGPVVAIAQDRVRHTFREKDAAQRIPDAPDTWMPVDPRLLRLAALDLGVLVEGARAGRWPLAPHPRRCPRVARGAQCALQAGCRVRRVPTAREG